MNLKDSVQFEFGSVIGLLKREMESGPITNLYLNLIRSKQLATECKQTACEPSLLSIFNSQCIFIASNVLLKIYKMTFSNLSSDQIKLVVPGGILVLREPEHYCIETKTTLYY